MTIELFGTLTSPYVRRVRAVAHELSLEVSLIDVFTEAGQQELREVHPLWRVPAMRVDGTMVYDSRVINDVLVREHGAGKLAAIAPEDVEAANVLTVIDGAVDSLINVFYLGRDGVTDASYVVKQRERAAAALAWLDARVDDVWVGPHREFGLLEIALCTSLGWMRFRDTYPIDRHPGLMRCLQHHDARPCLAETRPPVA